MDAADFGLETVSILFAAGLSGDSQRSDRHEHVELAARLKPWA
jgi:hypothetical protein